MPTPNPGPDPRCDDAAAPTGRRRVLLVEDQCDLRRVLSLTLAQRGREILERSDGPAALEALAQLRPELAIVDIDIPGFDGLTLVARARAELPDLETRFVFLSSAATDANRARGAELGAVAFVAKPFAPLELVRCVERALGGG